MLRQMSMTFDSRFVIFTLSILTVFVLTVNDVESRKVEVAARRRGSSFFELFVQQVSLPCEFLLRPYSTDSSDNAKNDPFSTNIPSHSNLSKGKDRSTLEINDNQDLNHPPQKKPREALSNHDMLHAHILNSKKLRAVTQSTSTQLYNRNFCSFFHSPHSKKLLNRYISQSVNESFSTTTTQPHSSIQSSLFSSIQSILNKFSHSLNRVQHSKQTVPKSNSIPSSQLNRTSTIPSDCILNSSRQSFSTMSHANCSHHKHNAEDLADVFLLPFTFTPTRYRLRLDPDMTKYTFSGVVDIDLKSVEASNEIVLNVADITIRSARFQTSSSKILEPVSIDIDNKDERATFKFSEKIHEDGVLHIEYDGILNDKMKGFYRSEYTWKGEKKIMAVTQFEANDARRAFPCWDEPGRKAIFDVQLVVDRHLDAISNMNTISVGSDAETGKKVMSFAPTPIMSTYLVAFFIGEFDYIEDYVQCMDTKIPIRVYAPPGEANMGAFALEVASKVLPNLEKFFAIPYPLPKLDMIAIPDFAAGAMENFGAISYRTTALLFNENSSSLATKQWIALVVAHEIGHQWFGNLASPSWWKYLYLNEAFATWLEYLQVDQIFPEWKIFNQFVELDFNKALELDSMESSHPVEVECKRAEDVDEIFDAISYSKGSSLLRMLVNYVGLNPFRDGLKIYLERFLYSNAASKDLWDAISEATNSDITTLMDGWTKQIGYPVIEVSEGKNSEGKRVLNVKQQRFLQKGPTNDTSIWRIPISYITDKNPEPTYVLLTKKEDSFPIPEDAKFIKINSQQSGFYRVQYSKDMLLSLVDAIRNKQIDPLDRLGVLDDICALAKSGYAEASHVLTVFTAFIKEDDFIVVKSLASNMINFHNYLKREESVASLYKQLGCSIFSGLGESLGWNAKPNESALDTLKRTIVIGALKKFEHEPTLKEGEARFKRVINKESGVVAPDLLGIVYSIGIARGGKDEYDAILRIYRETSLNEERVRCLGALGSSTDVDTLKSILDNNFILKEVKAQDIMYPLSSVAGNKNQGRELVWDWFSKNFDQVRNRIDNGFLFGRVLKISSSEFDTYEHKETVEKFLSQYDLPQLKRSIAQALEGIELNTEIKKRILSSVTPEVLRNVNAQVQ